MHVPTLLATLVLPLAAVAEEMTTTTSTSTVTLTKTVTLQRAEVTGGSNSFASFIPSSTVRLPASTTATEQAAATTSDKNAASALGAGHMGVVAVAGVVAAVLL
jgi:hypothetical protein